jgi:signal transduction histidine kinase
MDSQHQRSDGSFFPIEVMSNYFEYGGQAYSLGMVRDISERKQAEGRLRESMALLQELSARRDHAREEEKTRIAREIHDELGQQLTALRLGIGTIGFQAEHGRPIAPERVRALVGLVDEAIRTVRSIATDLRPAVLDSGLEAALQWLTVRSREQTGIDCACQIDTPLSPLDSYQEIALFRIAQESLTNIARHAKANHALVRVRCEGGMCKLEIRDDGCGFDAGAAGHGSFGLIGMRERALMLHGDMHIDSKSGLGTQVSVTIPCDRRAAA